MEKNKIITSLTLAGILTAGVLGGNSNAASNSQGVCKNIISGESLVPYILESAEDVVTSARLKAEYTTASNLELKYTDRVRTGDTFTTSTGKKTVLVYGDVNQDGRVTTLDASYAQSIVLGADATELQKAAADVRRNNNSINVTTVDASSIQEFVLNGGDYVNVKPVGEKDEVTAENEYVLTAQAGKINNQTDNKDVTPAIKTKLKLTPKTDFKNDPALTVEVYKLNEETGKYGDTDLAGTTGFIASTTVGVTPDLKEKEIEVNFSALVNADADNGTFKVVLKRGTTVVADTTVTTNIYTNSVNADVFITRVGSYGAQIGLMGYGEGTITKVYCLIGTSAETDAATIAEDGIAVAVSNNQILPAKLFNDDAHRLPQEDAVVSYVLEDADGNLVNVGSVDVADDTLTNAPAANIEKIEATDDTGLTFTITADDASYAGTVNVVLYRDGVVVTAKEVTAVAGVAVTDFDETLLTGDYNKPGKYTVKAYIPGTTDNQPSAVVDSKDSAKGTIVVTQLAKVAESGIAYDIKEEKLTWNYADNENVEFEVKLDGSTWGTVDTENAKVRTSASLADANTMYTVTVVAKDKNNSARVLASEEAKKEVFKLDLDDIQTTVTSAVTADSVELSGIVPMTIENGAEDITEGIEYRVEAWEYVSNDDEDGTRRVVNRKVALTKTDKADTYEVEVTGLKEDTRYDIKLFAIYNGVESVPVVKTAVRTVTSKKDLVINHIVGDETTKKDADKIWVDTNNSKVYVNGNENDISTYTESNAKVLNNIVSKLSKGDHVKVTGNNVEITVGSVQQEETEFGALEGYNVTITGNNTVRTLTATNSKADNMKLVGGFFTVDGTNYDNIVLDGTELINTAEVTYKVTTGKKSVINNIDVTATTAQAEVKPEAGKVTLTAGNSNVTLVNRDTVNSDLVVDVHGNPNLATAQTGAITITSAIGDITVSSDVNVSGKLTVNVEKGTADVTAVTYTGAKAINVTNKKDETTTVVANLKDNTISDLTATAAKAYAGEEKDNLIETLTTGGLTDEEAEKVVTFINSLNISKDSNATVAIADGVMTLTFTGTGADDYATVTYTVPASLIK